MSSSGDPRHISIPVNLPLVALSGDILLFPGDRAKITITSANENNFKLVKNRLLSDADSTSSDVADANLSQSPVIIGFMPRALPKDDGDLDNTLPMSLFGTAAVVTQVTAIGLPQPTFTLIVTGVSRIRVEKLVMEEPYPVAVVSVPVANQYIGTKQLLVAASRFRTLISKILSIMAQSSEFGTYYVHRLKTMIDSASDVELPDLFGLLYPTSYTEKLELLGTFDLMERYKLVMSMVEHKSKAMSHLILDNDQTKNRPSYILRIVSKDGHGAANGKNLLHSLNSAQRMKAIVPPDFEEDSLLELHNKLKDAQMPPQAWKVAFKDFQRLKRLTPHSAELPILRAYLELMSDLPWSKSTSETLDVIKAQQDLDADHYAMEKLKKRVLEYLAVRQLKNTLRGPILCFVGPPGVGKTSIGRSIAHTLNREFHRISLGGICNTSDIRGHRRTYIGAMPGRIIQALKTVNVNNPVMLLDEVDKLKAGMQGDPGAALLEVLDPEQNHTFHDHYLNVPFDLSQVMFIATANSVKTIPRALLDRMEVIEVEGYTHDEKLHIALRHLIPKQIQQHGLDHELIQIPAETVQALILGYTHEAGVRSLERRVGALCRDVAVKVAAKRSTGDATEVEPIIIDCGMLEEILGPAPMSDTQLWSRLGRPGVAVGMSVTSVGGEVLLVEASKMEGDGELTLTGQLGSVMKESANLALSYLRASAYKYGIILDSETLSHTDIHIHFPAGAIAKEGPSAGVALVAVLVSLFSNRPVATDVAMTGEISLKGAVLPVGGVRAKVLAAHRMGIRRIILPAKNAKDLLKISQDIKNELTFILVSHVDEAIQAAFEGGYPMIDNPDDVEPAMSSKL